MFKIGEKERRDKNKIKKTKRKYQQTIGKQKKN